MQAPDIFHHTTLGPSLETAPATTSIQINTNEIEILQTDNVSNGIYLLSSSIFSTTFAREISTLSVSSQPHSCMMELSD